MKGIVFTEFYRHIDEKFGEEALDEIIVAANLSNEGAYTSVGTYPFTEMVALVQSSTVTTHRSMGETLDGFGQHCFARWVNYLPEFFGPERNLFDILSEINQFHEVEVRKLYPDAELPTFTVEDRTERKLVVGYHSAKNLVDLAVGVIKGAAAHLGQIVTITAAPADGPSGPYALLTIELIDDLPAEARFCPRHSKT